ncbi:NAD(P)-binding protein [Pseudovirgaria hyperparasitica]|uniref:NAD(P)-binding protein n=1 Tax=Pseudovirgaria hyperparasitica TaxID=470096 RepID=A0A6A6W433_9PEZI|nr:NAD(P)-binding protein [Pseudovirgaria hyperparasitica]KAF2756726.1 NAD(P)-binding protein [Pseudovirgaria hyperparasitica]
MSLQPLKYLNKLAGKHVLVFGATSGIGFCIAEAAVEHGAKVVISGSNQDRINKTIERIKKSYPNTQSGQITGHVVDLSDTANLESNLNKLFASVSTDSKINHIAFTTGDALRVPPLSDTTPEDFQASGNVRTLAPLMLAKVLPKYMDLSPGNSFTLTGGTNSDRPMPGATLMALRGASNEGLMRALAVDLAPMRVNLVSPGAIQTELWSSFKSSEAEEGFVKKMTTETLLKEVGKPEDTAEAYIYAMKDRFVTGVVLHTNGGRLLANS